MNIIGVISAIFALIIGFIVGLSIKKSEIKRIEKENNSIKQQIDELKTTNQDKDKTVSVQNKELEIKSERLKELEEENRNFIKQLNELREEIATDRTKLNMIEELQKIVKDDFTKIANEVIKEEQSDLREQNREALEEKLKPIKDKFEEVKRQIEDFNKTEIKHTTELKSNIEGLIKESLSIKETANELTAAIKNNAQKRGVFGEIILENLLKQAGLINKNEDELKGNYITQKTFKDYAAPTEKPRPDAVIYLPENKNIIIDSKCPLNNFIEYCNNPDEGEKEKQLKQFYNSVSEMITDLSVKYNTLEGLQTPEFKLMFIPLESCASYIYANDELTKKSINNNIIIVCPSTLFATLKLVNQIWKRETQINDLDKIIKTATSTYNKLVTFVEKLEKVRTKFTETANSFDEVFTTATGQGGFVKQIANLEKVIVTPKKKLNEKYISE